jgi:hypothetical protein
MNETTLIMAYYRNPTMLKRHYDLWGRLSDEIKAKLRIIIVDDGSPKELQAPLPPSDLAIPTSIFRLLVDIRWNQDACRNLGVEKSTTPWILLTDMDHMVTPKLLERLIFNVCDPRIAYRFGRVSAPGLEPYKFHPNSWFMTRRLYNRIGGYDERFAGWYGTDGDFRDRLNRVAGLVEIKEHLIRVPREVVPDASTTIYERKTDEDGEAIKRIKAERGDNKPIRQGFPYEQVL